ncbi:hypothetical protein LDC_0135, partial [sediment metagenome]
AARLLFFGLSQLPGIGIEGLIQSSNRVLARGLPGAARASGGGMSEDRRIDRLSRVVVSLQQRRPATGWCAPAAASNGCWRRPPPCPGRCWPSASR